ncbi:dTDP-4-dehydrorhamnose 3,5-epimerase [hydrothermal vent metagenome]|uniref:dTDP-4-dehydrorhamnose 3,5-epimerase n=1 Tax=hydrothermal vent metagenome TaxID=652676 RepID=A0A3B0VSE6_9ZZZZ
MKVTKTKLAGVLVFEPKVFGDRRGFFMESWNYQRYRDAGLDVKFIQSNLSKSAKGVLRGLHFQNPNPQGKLVQIITGEVFDVAVDIRRGSPTFGQWHGEYLCAANHKQLYIPEGFAHGFCVLSELAVFSYMCTSIYDAQADCSIMWNDPTINIKWPISNPSLSAKDEQAVSLEQINQDKLPVYCY